MFQDPRYSQSPRSRNERDSPSRVRVGYAGYRQPYVETASTSSGVTRVHRANDLPGVAMTNADQHRTRSPHIASLAAGREYSRAPPPATRRSPASSIDTKSYMDYDSNDLPSPSVHSSISQRLPAISEQASYQPRPFLSAPRRRMEPAPEDYYRERPDPRRLLPTAVRAPVSFTYSQEPVRDSASRYSDRSSREPDQQPRLCTIPGTARQVTHAELDRAYSQPYEWQDGYEPRAPSPPPDMDPQLNWQSREVYGQPFIYEAGRAYTVPSASGSAGGSRSGRSTRAQDRYEQEEQDNGSEESAYGRDELGSRYGASRQGAYDLRRRPVPHNDSPVRADTGQPRGRGREDESGVEIRTADGTIIRAPGGSIVEVHEEELGADGVWRPVR